MIKALDAAQDEGSFSSLSSLPSVQLNPQAPDPSPSPSEPTPASPSSSYPASSSHSSYPQPAAAAPISPAAEGPEQVRRDTPFLSAEERRRILAQIARVNPLDCLDASGAFDLARARLVLSPGSISRLTVHETTRPNAEGQPVTERRIDVRLFNPVSALRLDEQIERRERAASNASPPTHSDSDSESPPPAPNTPEYGPYLLRQKSRGLDEATRTLALLKKALAEKQDRQRRLIKELEETEHQLSNTADKVKIDAAQSRTALQSHDQFPQGDTGLQPVPSIYQTSPPSQTLTKIDDQPPSHAEAQAPGNVAGKPRENRELIKIQLRRNEIEHRRNTSGHLGFTRWLQAQQKEWAKIDSIDSQSRSTNLHGPGHQETAATKSASAPARPPPA